MRFVYEERPSESPFVEAIWRTEDTSDGTYLAAADGAWDLIFTEHGSEHRILLSGPSSRATPVPYQAGNRNFGIRFQPGVFMPALAAMHMVDVTDALPQKTKQRFWLQGESWQLPTFDNVDEFLAKLARLNLLATDTIVTAVLAGHRPPLCDRSIQRHFMHTIGLAPRYVQNIHRANRAVTALQQGSSIADVAVELGYADQAHLTRHVKRVSGRTPGQIVRAVEACRLRSIQGYGPCAQMKVQNFKGGSYDYQTLQDKHPQKSAR
jgi:AraC-like DNA-binding protein